MKKNTTQKNFPNILIIIVICLFAAFGKALVSSSRTNTNANKWKTFTTDTPYLKYNGVATKDKLTVNTENKLTGAQHQYTINGLPNSREQIKKLDMNKQYISKNNDLITKASMVYGFIISNDYKAVKYCSNYYPLTNVKRKADIRFKAKKEKAEAILNTAFGQDGAKQLARTILSNTNAIQVFQKQMEDDYLSEKKLAEIDGIKDFTRKEYCKTMEDNANAVVEEEYKRLEMMAPNF